jgi:hypothetical protein
MKFLLKYLLLGAFTMGAAAAHADPIGPTCPKDSCFGNIFTLEYVAVTATHYQITLTIDTTSYAGPDTDWISAVSIKPASGILNTSTFTSTTAPGSWAGQLGGLSSGGCNGSGSGFICASSASHSAVTDGSTYEWLFDIYVANANDWMLGVGELASIKANYDPDTGRLTSEDIQLQQGGGGPPNEIPEPQSLALLGLGLLALAFARRRRNG